MEKRKAGQTISAAVAAVGALLAARAYAGGLDRASSTVSSLTSDVRVIVPAVAVLALICLGLAWGAKWIRFVTLVQFGAGLILAASAAELVSMLFT
jgi:hypothetical protein